MSSDLNSASFPVVKSDEFLPPISLWTRLGGLFLVGTFGAAIALAALTKYNQTVRASATVRPTGETRIVQAAIEATIKSIEAKENQEVKRGMAIATLDDSRLQTQKNQLQGNIQQLLLQIGQMDAQMKSLDNQIAAETERMNRTVASEKAELTRTLREYQDRKITTASQVQEAESNLKIARYEWQQAQSDLKSAEASLMATEASLKAAKARRDRYQPLVEAGGLSQDQFSEAILAVEQLLSEMESQTAIIESKKQKISQQQQAIEAAEARLQGTLAALNPSDSAVAIAKENVEKEIAAGKVSLAKISQEREQLSQKRVEIENQLSRDRAELQQIERELKHSVIRSPVDGIILQLNLRNAGQVVKPGESIAQIAPSGAPLEVKARVEAGDIGKIAAEQTAYLRVSACPYPDYGTLKATVSAISPDAIASATPTVTFYEVTVKPESLSLRNGDRVCPLLAGMEATADIISRQETVLTFILRKARLLTDL